MPPTRPYTNHTRSCVRSRSGTHGKISQHNSRHKLRSYKLYITSQGPRELEYISSNTNESAEATISEYRHKSKTDKPLDGGAKQRQRSKRRRPPAWVPPNLLLVVGGILIVVVSANRVEVVIGGAAGSGAPSSGRSNRIWGKEVAKQP